MFKIRKNQLPKRLPQLALVSFIAACSEAPAEEFYFADGFDSRVGGGDPVIIGSRPTDPVPEKLSATGQLAEASIETLAPVADIGSNHISADITKDSMAGDPQGRVDGLKDLVVTIDAASGLVNNNFEITFKNGNHTAGSASASVYELVANGKQDLIVASSDFGDLDGAKTGAIYIVWDIREKTTLDDTPAANNNFLKIGGTDDISIRKDAPNFFHIDGDEQYDMIFGADATVRNFNSSHIYIVWDVTKYAGTDNQDFTPSSVPTKTTITSDVDIDISKYTPEFLHIGGDDAQYDMVIRGEGNGAEGRIYIVWDIVNPTDSDISLSIPNNDNIFFVYARDGDDKIASYAPEFLYIGGDGAQYDMVIRSDGIKDNSRTNTTGGIFILWDVAEYFIAGIAKAVALDITNSAAIVAADHGLLSILGEAENKKIGKHSPKFLQLGGVDASNTPQQDMIFRSEDGTGTIYILWDVAAYYSTATTAIDLGTNAGITKGLLKITDTTGENIGKHSSELFQLAGTDTPDDMIIRSDTAIYVLWDVAAYYDNAILTTPVNVDLSGSPTHGLLKITAAENIGKYDPEFLQIGGVDASSVAQQDMIIRSDTAIYVLWDVAEYHSTASTPIDLSGNSVANGLLKITDTTGEKIGQNAPDILKINNNDDYDMIIKSDANMYILWDFTKDYSTTPASVSLTAASASTGNGLLTISGAGTADVLKVTGSATGTDGSFLDIDSKGINDIVFTDGGNTFILFGEKVADRDTNEKAISDTVNLTAIKALNFDGGAGFFTADKVTTVAADAIGYRYANDDHDTLAAVQGNPPAFSLSDADAVWDIA